MLVFLKTLNVKEARCVRSYYYGPTIQSDLKWWRSNLNMFKLRIKQEKRKSLR